MTSTPSEPRLYDVWLMWVEFPDHPGIGKPRPVVITEVDGDLVSGIVAKITGNTDMNIRRLGYAALVESQTGTS